MSQPPSAGDPIPIDNFCPLSIKRRALEQDVTSVVEKDEVALSSPGFYSCMFTVQKALVAWPPTAGAFSLCSLQPVSTWDISLLCVVSFRGASQDEISPAHFQQSMKFLGRVYDDSMGLLLSFRPNLVV